MFQLDRRSANCQGVSRRSFLRVGSLGLFGLTLPRLLESHARAVGQSIKDINCILLWTDGGNSNIDTFDMKPQAPVEYRGEFAPIATNLPGVQVCEHLPLISQRMHKLCQVRSIVHTGSQHAEACHFMQTGYPQVPDVNAAPVGSTVYPCFGSVVSREKGWAKGMPPYVQFSAGGIKYAHAGYMGAAYNALMIRPDPSAANFSVEDVTIPGSIGSERTKRRRQMLARLDAWQRDVDRSAGAVFDRHQFYQQAYDLVTSPTAKRAFKLDEEPDELRDRYGRHREGQSTLLARRLVEAGVRFATVEFNGYDTHADNFGRLKKELLPKLDQAWTALLDDLEERGLLDTTPVICAGEFGRTPRVNGAAGRDHYPAANVVCFTGAGTAEGTIVGRTDDRCERVVGRADSTLDFAATMFRLLGIDDTKEYTSNDGRPVLINGGGTAIPEVFA
jgi:hypothetical protein